MGFKYTEWHSVTYLVKIPMLTDQKMSLLMILSVLIISKACSLWTTRRCIPQDSGSATIEEITQRNGNQEIGSDTENERHS